MQFTRLFETDTPGTCAGVALLTVLAGVGNAALIGLVNHAAGAAARWEPVGPATLALYVGLFVVYVLANRAALREADRLLQERLDLLRRRVVGKIRRAPLRALERIGHGDLYATVAQEMNHLSQNMPLFAGAAQSAVLLVFLLLYIATVSLPSFAVVAAFTAAGAALFWRRRAALNQALAAVHADEAAMLDAMSHFTGGFQEIRLHAGRNDALFARFGAIVDDLERSVVGVGGRWVALLQFANAFLYVLVGVVVLALPLVLRDHAATIYKIAAATIFCVGPVNALTSVSHLFARAEIGLGHVRRLEEALDRVADPAPTAPPAAVSRFAGFARIDFEHITFSYLDERGQALFTSGPWDFSLRRGEIVFLTGGNGSGKSTAMKLACGLYEPSEGRILVDGAPVGAEARQDYRELFSAIFPDFHLFDRPHGLRGVDEDAVAALIARMDLSDKVAFANGRFSTLDLSTGQRKRLAMVVALLEDRPVYLFDEWAADQDARFREVFYAEILPDLRRRGKAVLAVTHDERYWDRCDRRVVLDLGLMRPAAEG